MLKLIFWLLLLANAVLFAFRMGYLGSLTTSKGESERLAKQLNVNKIKIVSATPKPSAALPGASSASAAASTAASTAASASTATPSAPLAKKDLALRKLVPCTEVGEFSDEKAEKFEVRLVKLVPDDRRVRRVRQKVATYMVHIPPQGSKAAAEKKAQELRSLGVTNFFIIKDNPKMRWGISLGVFKSETLAKKHLANLKKNGVRSARVSARSVEEKRVTFILRDMDSDSIQSLQKIMVDFPEQKSRECGKP